MTLHQTAAGIKKAGIGTGIGITGIIILVILFRVGIMIKNVMYPPKIEPPTFAYGNLPALQFPQNAIEKEFTYSIYTLTGALPTDFPDRLTIFPIVKPRPNFLNLDNAKKKVTKLGFISDRGTVLPEKALGNANYEWNLELSTGILKKMIMNIVSFDFSLDSNYLASTIVLEPKFISDQKSAVKTVTDFLTVIELLSADIDPAITTGASNNIKYITAPRLYDISNAELTPSTSLVNTKVIRVDLYQKDVEYELNTGRSDDKNVIRKIKVKYPILYPHPPFSTMSFWVASGRDDAEVFAADFSHQAYTIPTDTEGTYPIKTPDEAFEELKSGKAYIASYNGNQEDILIRKVYIAYYMGKEKQDYLMPIIVFEGDKDFFAYVSAVRDEYIETSSN